MSHTCHYHIRAPRTQVLCDELEGLDPAGLDADDARALGVHAEVLLWPSCLVVFGLMCLIARSVDCFGGSG